MIARSQRVRTGELAGSTTAVAFPDIPAGLVRFRARGTNAGNVYLGGVDDSGNALATLPDGTTDVTTGFELAAGDDTGWMLVDNLKRFSRICDNAGDALTYMIQPGG